MRARLEEELNRPAVLERVLGERPLDGSVGAYDWDEAADFARRRWSRPDGDHPPKRRLHEAAHELGRGAEIDLW